MVTELDHHGNGAQAFCLAVNVSVETERTNHLGRMRHTARAGSWLRFGDKYTHCNIRSYLSPPLAKTPLLPILSVKPASQDGLRLLTRALSDIRLGTEDGDDE